MYMMNLTDVHDLQHKSENFFYHILKLEWCTWWTWLMYTICNTNLDTFSINFWNLKNVHDELDWCTRFTTQIWKLFLSYFETWVVYMMNLTDVHDLQHKSGNVFCHILKLDWCTWFITWIRTYSCSRCKVQILHDLSIYQIVLANSKSL